MSFPKPRKWENKAYRNAAKNEDCKLRLNGCRNEKETVVLCHCPGWLNKIIGSSPIGGGTKASDYNAVDGCHKCHEQLDGRTNTSGQTEIITAFLRGRYETIVNRIERGVLK